MWRTHLCACIPALAMRRTGPCPLFWGVGDAGAPAIARRDAEGATVEVAHGAISTRCPGQRRTSWPPTAPRGKPPRPTSPMRRWTRALMRSATHPPLAAPLAPDPLWRDTQAVAEPDANSARPKGTACGHARKDGPGRLNRGTVSAARPLPLNGRGWPGKAAAPSVPGPQDGRQPPLAVQLLLGLGNQRLLLQAVELARRLG